MKDRSEVTVKSLTEKECKFNLEQKFENKYDVNESIEAQYKAFIKEISKEKEVFEVRLGCEVYETDFEGVLTVLGRLFRLPLVKEEGK